MNDYVSATLLPFEEKINYLDSSDRQILDEIMNYMLMTHELLQNHRECLRPDNQAPGFQASRAGDPEYLGNHH